MPCRAAAASVGVCIQVKVTQSSGKHTPIIARRLNATPSRSFGADLYTFRGLRTHVARKPLSAWKPRPICARTGVVARLTRTPPVWSALVRAWMATRKPAQLESRIRNLIVNHSTLGIRSRSSKLIKRTPIPRQSPSLNLSSTRCVFCLFFRYGLESRSDRPDNCSHVRDSLPERALSSAALPQLAENHRRSPRSARLRALGPRPRLASFLFLRRTPLPKHKVSTDGASLREAARRRTRSDRVVRTLDFRLGRGLRYVRGAWQLGPRTDC